MSYSSPEHRPPEPVASQEWMAHLYTARDWAYGIFRDEKQHITEYSTDTRVIRGVDWTGDTGLVGYELECVDDYSDTGFDIASRYRLLVRYDDGRPWERYQIVAGENEAYRCDDDWEIALGQNIQASTKAAIGHLRTNSVDAATMQTYGDMNDTFWKTLEANGMRTARYRFARWCGRLLNEYKA